MSSQEFTIASFKNLISMVDINGAVITTIGAFIRAMYDVRVAKSSRLVTITNIMLSLVIGYSFYHFATGIIDSVKILYSLTLLISVNAFFFVTALSEPLNAITLLRVIIKPDMDKLEKLLRDEKNKKDKK